MPHEYDKRRLALRKNIIDEIAKYGANCSLNHLDLTGVKNMDALFEGLDFNGDISNWDVSQVISMQWLFKETPFNSDISKWDISHVKCTSGMFAGSAFNGDISKWDTSQVEKMDSMFAGSAFNGDISNWNVANCVVSAFMFKETSFNGDLAKWDMSNVRDTTQMFANSTFNQPLGSWNLNRATNVSDMFPCSAYQGTMPTLNVECLEVPNPALSTAYRGDFQSKYSLEEARVLLGSTRAVDAYLQGRVDLGYTLDRLHIEKIVTSTIRPEWTSKALFNGLNLEKNLHQNMGLSLQDSLVLLDQSYHEKYLGQSKAVVDTIAFDFSTVQ